MIIHMRHTLWTGISETNVNIITSATRTHAFNNNNKHTFDSLSVELISSHYISGKLMSPTMMQFILVMLSNVSQIFLKLCYFPFFRDGTLIQLAFVCLGLVL